MKAIFLIFFVFIGLPSMAQKNTYQVIKFPELQQEINNPEDHIRVFNFWATWCRPCIQEMPYFEALNQEYSDVEVILISFDFKHEHERVGDFIEKRGIKSTVKILDEIDFNAFIDKINSTWTGAIPATLIIDADNEQYFYQQSFEKEELFKLINKIKQQKL